MTHMFIIAQEGVTPEQREEIDEYSAENKWSCMHGPYFLIITGELHFFDYLKYKIGVDTEAFVCYKI